MGGGESDGDRCAGSGEGGGLSCGGWWRASLVKGSSVRDFVWKRRIVGVLWMGQYCRA